MYLNFRFVIIFNYDVGHNIPYVCHYSVQHTNNDVEIKWDDNTKHPWKRNQVILDKRCDVIRKLVLFYNLKEVTKSVKENATCPNTWKFVLLVVISSTHTRDRNFDL